MNTWLNLECTFLGKNPFDDDRLDDDCKDSFLFDSIDLCPDLVLAFRFLPIRDPSFRWIHRRRTGTDQRATRAGSRAQGILVVQAGGVRFPRKNVHSKTIDDVC